MTENWEAELDKINEKVANWQEKFRQSEFYRQLTATEQEYCYLIDAFVNINYHYFENKPEEWTKEQIKRCCGEIIPQKVAAEEAYFNSLPGVLSAFFEFLASRGILEQGSELAQAVYEIREEIRASAADSEHWSPGKRFVHEAEQAGIDLTDKRELEEFISQFEVKFNQESERDDSEWKVGRNESCPCGSGKKYKKCCLLDIKRQQPYDRALERLLEKILDFFWELESSYSEQINDYFSRFAQTFNLSVYELPTEAEVIASFNLIFDLQLEDGQTVLEMFKAQRGANLGSKEKSVLNHLIGQRLQVYQVAGQRDKCYQLENLFAEETVLLTNREEDFQMGEIVAGRTAKIGREVQFVGFYNVVSGRYKELIQDEIGRWAADNDQFWRLESHKVMKLFTDLSELSEEEIEIVHEVSYITQSPEVVKKRLTKQPNIVIEEVDTGVTVLNWLSEEDVGVEQKIKGKFLVDETNLVYVTPFEDQVTPGKKLIESELTFLIDYDEEYRVDIKTGEVVEWISRSQEVVDDIVKDFITAPLPFEGELKGEIPKELAQTEAGRAKLKDYLDQLELMAEYLYAGDPDFFQVDEVKQIKQKLGISVISEQVVKDGVEKLIAEKMQARDLMPEIIFESILLWRDYKQTVDSLRGQDKSWAAAVEYLAGCLNVGFWSPTQSEVSEVYGVTENTISKKYRRIAEKLGL